MASPRVRTALLAALLGSVASVGAVGAEQDAAGPDAAGPTGTGASADSAAQTSPFVRPPRLDLLYPGTARAGITLTHPGLRLPPSLLAPSYATLRPNTFQSLVYGADRGAYAGLTLGFLGWMSGFLEEEDALLLMGAGAALGAVWGGTAGAANEGFRVRVRSRP